VLGLGLGFPFLVLWWLRLKHRMLMDEEAHKIGTYCIEDMIEYVLATCADGRMHRDYRDHRVHRK